MVHIWTLSAAFHCWLHRIFQRLCTSHWFGVLVHASLVLIYLQIVLHLASFMNMMVGRGRNSQIAIIATFIMLVLSCTYLYQSINSGGTQFGDPELLMMKKKDKGMPFITDQNERPLFSYWRQINSFIRCQINTSNYAYFAWKHMQAKWSFTMKKPCFVLLYFWLYLLN